MKTTLYRPDDDIEVFSLLMTTIVLLLQDARISEVVLRNAPCPVEHLPTDPEEASHHKNYSDAERAEKGWRHVLPMQNYAADIREFRLEYGWRGAQVMLVAETCTDAAADLRERAPSVPLSGTRRSMQHAAGMLDQLSSHWRALLHDENTQPAATLESARTGLVWFAILDAHEQETWPCSSERAAYERLVQYAYASSHAEDVPENGEIEDIAKIWNEITGDEYMRVTGPHQVFHFDG